MERNKERINLAMLSNVNNDRANGMHYYVHIFCMLSNNFQNLPKIFHILQKRVIFYFAMSSYSNSPSAPIYHFGFTRFTQTKRKFLYRKLKALLLR